MTNDDGARETGVRLRWESCLGSFTHVDFRRPICGASAAGKEFKGGDIELNWTVPNGRKDSGMGTYVETPAARVFGAFFARRFHDCHIVFMENIFRSGECAPLLIINR